MKFLTVLIFAGISLASAVPLQPRTHELDRRVEVNESHDIFEAETESTLDEVKEQLRERVNEILKKIKEVIDTGKLFKKETIEKLKELNEKLKNELGVEGFKKLKDRTGELLRKLLENFGFHTGAAVEHAEDIMEEAKHADVSDIIKMKEVLEELITKAKDTFDNGSTVTEYLEKIQQIRDALKLFNIDLGEKAKEYIQVWKDKMRDYWNKLKEKLTTKRSADANVFGMFEELKKLIKENLDLNKAKEFIEKVFGKGNEVRETLLNWLNEKGGKQKILDFIDRILGEKESQYSIISDYFHKVKDYFKELNIELHEKYAKFGHWIKEQYEGNLEKGKDKAESLKLIAQEFLHDTRVLEKHMAVEAKFFFTEYKNELGDMFKDVMKKITYVLDEPQYSIITDYFQKVKDYFKELNIELHEKYAKFGHWIKQQYEENLQKGKDKADSLKLIAQEFLHDTRTLGKHVAVEAKFFFTEYKNELGDMFKDVMKKISKVLEDKPQNSISDYFHKVKNYFKELNIELHEKYAKFGHWIKEQYEDNLEKGKDKADSLKLIAHEFLQDSRMLEKHMAVEAKFFFTEYKNELGDMFKDVMTKIAKVLEDKPHHSISDYFHKVKNYFKELNIELHEKYAKFGHWIKEQYEDNLEKGKDKTESLKLIAHEFLDDTRMMSKHMAVEAKYFFTEYRKELGDMFKDVMKKVTNVLEN